MTKLTEKRRRYFVDPHVQGALVRHAACYWLCGSAIFGLIAGIYRVYPAWLSGNAPEANRIWADHLGPFFVASVALFPIVVFGVIRISHRFVGPMLRFRRNLRQLARGESPPEIVLRDGDFWTDVAADINEVAARFRQLQRESKIAAPGESPPLSYASSEVVQSGDPATVAN